MRLFNQLSKRNHDCKVAMNRLPDGKRKKDGGTIKDLMQKDRGKGTQTGRVGQLGRSQRYETRQGWLESKQRQDKTRQDNFI